MGRKNLMRGSTPHTPKCGKTLFHGSSSMFLDRGSSVPNTANLEVSGVCIYFSRLARVKGRNQDPRSGALFFYVMTLLRDSLRATLPRDLADGLRCA
ncbi:hypothetical protein N7468_006908 [Penicillium chermesinum]|uniref:Uncharacterized protein n=1 Tax=Penicillium chermesinum TaxID=63820 RepID=A0A9W9NVH7_9EURO|nr:uncharacterized protein N7468_006908 [Penicillium chermesinum]KAJ5225683.1 hypothetical protein N7468_006908 [Penicillium chermesinum]